MNYQLVTIQAQIHDDDWYSDNPAVLGGAGRQPTSQTQTPRPLIGLIRHNDSHGNFEFFDFQVKESYPGAIGWHGDRYAHRELFAAEQAES